MRKIKTKDRYYAGLLYSVELIESPWEELPENNRFRSWTDRCIGEYFPVEDRWKSWFWEDGDLQKIEDFLCRRSRHRLRREILNAILENV